MKQWKFDCDQCLLLRLKLVRQHMIEQTKEVEIASEQASEEKRKNILHPRDDILLVGPFYVIWIESMNSTLVALTYLLGPIIRFLQQQDSDKEQFIGSMT
ncbi:MAG: hypothetical protein EZS28_013011 [Streblomastix strix]|uniref:Uncharacterized protein n=1 Tax=Streblomastix strix TaxID=222440 RepID=A0A5J4W9B9_9EUKA|nr:MAG: hypothetical protein EZS28_013011 [Streblomastix strix]